MHSPLGIVSASPNCLIYIPILAWPAMRLAKLQFACEVGGLWDGTALSTQVGLWWHVAVPWQAVTSRRRNAFGCFAFFCLGFQTLLNASCQFVTTLLIGSVMVWHHWGSSQGPGVCAAPVLGDLPALSSSIRPCFEQKDGLEISWAASSPEYLWGPCTALVYASSPFKKEKQ